MQQQRVIRVGTTAILLSLVLRLFAVHLPQRLLPLVEAALPSHTDTKTGQTVRFSPSMKLFFPDFVETPRPSLPKPTEPPIPLYSEPEAIELFQASDVQPDIAELLAKPLQWQLRSDSPTVLILHTHATESYTKQQEPYQESAAWRTLDANFNMLSIGSLVAARLEAAGISVIHDISLHDRPSYNGAYVAAREAVAKQLEANPSICLVLDLHRDAAERSYGQLRTKAEVDGKRSAQLMMVVGTNHEGYEQNLSLALKLHAQLERQVPGIARPLQLRSARYNQDLSPGSLIVEVGAAGNTHPEAKLAAEQLAQAIITLARGTRTPD